MDKPSVLKQIFDSLAPYAAPIFGTFIALYRFCRSYTKDIEKKFNKIQLDVAILKKDNDNQSKSIEKMDAKIDRINEIVHELSAQEHGVLTAALSQMEKVREDVQEERKQFMEIVSSKFSEYDRKFIVLFKQKKRLVK